MSKHCKEHQGNQATNDRNLIINKCNTVWRSKHRKCSHRNVFHVWFSVWYVQFALCNPQLFKYFHIIDNHSVTAIRISHNNDRNFECSIIYGYTLSALTPQRPEDSKRSSAWVYFRAHRCIIIVFFSLRNTIVNQICWVAHGGFSLLRESMKSVAPRLPFTTFKNSVY